MKIILKPWPYPKRKKEIDSRLGSPSTIGNYPVKFMGKNLQLPIYCVDYEMPVYRLSNGRTGALQQEFIKQENKPEDFFTKDPESVEALNAQHEILKKYADDADMFNYFKNEEHEQEEPIILDQSGFIVNGNRRLCVWRILVDEDPIKYQQYKRVLVVFLPKSDTKEIEILEAKLQTAPSIKAKYGWVSEALLFKRQMKEHNWSPEVLANIHETKVTHVNNYISMLDEADKFLAQKGKSREYSCVVDKEFGFERIIKLRPDLPNASKRENFTLLCYNAFTRPEAIGDRIYKIVKEIYDSMDGMEESLYKVFPSVIDEKIEQGTQKVVKIPQDEPLFSGAIGKSDVTNIKLTAELKKPENQDIINQVLSNELEKTRWLKRQQKEENLVLEYVSDAQSQLRNALLNLNSKSNVKGVSKQLDQIQELLEQLRKRIVVDDKN